MSQQQIIKAIRTYRRFLISAHTNMEGDALGSELAFYHLVRKLGKQATVINDDVVPYGYGFLPRLDVIRRYHQGMKVPAFDCFVAVDCSDLRRTGEVQRIAASGKPILNIDHHVSNARFGTVNWVDAEASCCCEMIYRLYKTMRVGLDRVSALLLYAGILTDTGSFRYSNTTSVTHAIAAELVSYGIDVSRVYKNIYADIPFADLKLLTRILPTMQKRPDGKVVWFQIPRGLLAGHPHLAFDLSESVLSYGRSLQGAEVVLLFKENLSVAREVRVNFRSQGKADVNAIAQKFGGGGHRTASGATIRGSLDDVRRRVLRTVNEAVK